MRTLVGIATLLAVPALLVADGGFIPLTGRAAGQGLTTSAAQKAVLIQDGKHEILLLQTTYSGPAAGFAWVIPVPSRPAPGDIFIASVDFLKGAFVTTQPIIRSHLSDPWSTSFGMAGGPGGKETAGRVTVWGETLVGDYQATVLSATAGAALPRWLRGNGYAVPDSLGPVAEEYTRQGWFFVALRMNPERVPGGRLLREVQPLGLRFRTDRLVFPLRISTLSAPARTSVLLVVYAAGSVQPRELPVLNLPDNTVLAAGDAYPALVRRTLGQRGGRALLVERRQPAGRNADSEKFVLTRAQVGPDFAAGRYRQEPPGPPLAGWSTYGVTRLVGLLPREAMVDLTFEPGPYLDTAVRISRRGTVRYPAWAEALWRGWPQLLVMALLMVGAYRRQQRPGTPLPPRPGEESAGALGRRYGCGALLALLAVVAVAQPFLLLYLPLMLWPLTLPLVTWGLTSWLTRSSRYRDFWTWWITATVVVVLCLPSALAHTVGQSWLGGRTNAQLSSRLEALDAAVKSFTHRYQCYPAALSDLTIPQPTQGLDASGNPVAFTARGPGQPSLERLPVDPLTGRRDTWVYDVLAPGLVDSGGYKVHVSSSSYAPH